MDKFFFILCLIFLPAAAGCAHLFQDSAAVAKEKEKVELKKKQFAALYGEISEGKISNGTPATKIRELYGEPEDIFRSGSTQSKMEIWTYEQIVEKNDDDAWQPIKLYFENNQLISWKY